MYSNVFITCELSPSRQQHDVLNHVLYGSGTTFETGLSNRRVHVLRQGTISLQMVLRGTFYLSISVSSISAQSLIYEGALMATVVSDGSGRTFLWNKWNMPNQVFLYFY